MKNISNEDWLSNNFGANVDTIIEALKMSPSSQGYVFGAISEIFLSRYLKKKGFKVWRIKEKPAGGFAEKKLGYKGDFLIQDKTDKNRKFYVIECKGLKSNSEFRSAQTDDKTHLKKLTPKQAYNILKKFIDVDKNKIYETGLKTYNETKQKWEQKNKKIFPKFKWNKNYPGPDNVDLSEYFKTEKNLEKFINNSDSELLSENSFRARKGLFKILQTHEPNGRTDNYTKIHQAAPLVSDFSIMAVDLYLRIGKHKFVFMNPKKISHSPSSPNHLYQNYIIDIIIPGKKNALTIKHPWYLDIKECIETTKPSGVKFDKSQLDFRKETCED